MRCIAILLLTQIAVFAQPSKPEELSVIEGRVVNSATGGPLAKADLTLERIDQKSGQANWERSYTANSDSSGKFLIRNILPGQYRLRASHSGFLDFEYGSRKAQANGTVLDLKQPQQIKDAELRLTPQGVITGRIVDADGEPMEATIQLLRQRYVYGKKVMMAARIYLANDIGEYRISGLSPGKYYLYVEARKSTTPLSEIPEEYVPVYYPGSMDMAGAATIDVLPGSQLRAGDVVLHKERTVRVRGKVVANVPATDGFQQVRVSRNIGHENATGYGSSAAVATVDSSGKFEARGINARSLYGGHIR